MRRKFRPAATVIAEVEQEALDYWASLTDDEREDWWERIRGAGGLTPVDSSTRPLTHGEKLIELISSAHFGSPGERSKRRAADAARKGQEQRAEAEAWAQGYCRVNGELFPADQCPEFVRDYNRKLADKFRVME